MKHINKLLALLIVSLFTVGTVFAGSKTESFEKKMFQALGSSNQGTTFYLTFHPCHESNGSKKNEHNIYITSDVATNIRVTIPGKEIERRATTIPYGIVKIGFSPAEGQCYQKDIPDEPLPHRIFRDFAIIVEADDPIVVYGVTRYSLTSDGFLGIPVSGYGTQYVVESYNDYTSDASGSSYYTSYFSVIGVSDKTEVTCYLGGYHTSYTPGGDKWVPGKKRKKVLNEGDVWLVGVMGDFSDLTGTLVESNKPVSVISGNFRTGIPISFASRDYLIEHMLPTHTWGYKYHVTPIFGRKAGSIIRIFATKNKTDIYRDGEQWARVKQGEGGTEMDGAYVEKVASNIEVGPRPVTISADSRIHVSQYNPTGYFDGSNTDPFMIALTPIDQYQTEIVFCTPGFQGEGFKDNYLNLCYKSTVEGNIPNDMEFGYGLNGQIQWRKLSSYAPSPGEAFIDPDVTDGRQWKNIQMKLWDPQGVYGIRSETPFAAYGYGFESADSYGYPLSAALRDLSKPDIWTPKPSYIIDCFGDVEGEVYDEPYHVDSLRSNLAAVALDKKNSYNYDLEIVDKENFIPGNTIELDWKLHIDDVESDAKAVMLFTDRAGNDTTLTIEYQRTFLKISPRIKNWGQLAYNDPAKTITMTLINESAKSILVDSIILLSSAFERDWEYNGFTIDQKIYTDNILPRLMAEGEELKFDVTFDPNTVKDLILSGKASFIDSVGIKANYDENIEDYCYYKYKAVVKSVTGRPFIEVDRMDFGKHTLDTKTIIEVPVYNNGSAPLNITGYSMPAEFSGGIYIPELEGLGPNDGFNIPADDYKMLAVEFTPKEVRQYPDQIVFESDADTTYENHDPVCEITGAGIVPGIVVTGTVWTDMRVHLSAYNDTGNPYGNKDFPYTLDDRSSNKYGLTLYNNASEPVTVTGIKVESSNKQEYFQINKQPIIKYIEDNIRNNEFQTGIDAMKEYLVTYNPLDTGTHFVNIIFEAEANGYTVRDTCEFRGNAIYPNAIPDNYMFTDGEDRETAIVGNPHKEYFDKEIVIINDATRPNADVLTIYDIKTDNSDLISITGSISGNQVFMFNKDGIFGGESSITLAIGEELRFIARFYPTRTGGYNGHPEFDANVIFVTDADQTEYISNWRAKAVEQLGTAEGIQTVQCKSYSANPDDANVDGKVYDDDYLGLLRTISVTNTGDDVLHIEKIEFASPELFALKNDIDKIPFDVSTGATKIIEVYYSNQYTGFVDDSEGIKFFTENVVEPIISTYIDVITVDYNRHSKGLIDGKEYSAAKPFLINYEKTPGKGVSNEFKYTVEINELIPAGEMEHLIGNTNFEVVINYNTNYLGVKSNTVNEREKIECKIGSELKATGYTITDAIEMKIDELNSQIIVQIENDNPIKIDSKFDMLSIIFTVYQNGVDVDKQTSKTIISHEIHSENACLDIDENSAHLELLEVCAQNTRLIKYTGHDFAEPVITPSPIGSEGGTMTYELGFECLTNISIYNEQGKLVATPINSIQTSGKHTVLINSTNMSSGVYMVKLTAGPFETVKRILINK